MLPLFVGPDWDWLIAWRNHAPEALGGIRRRNSMGRFAALSGEDVLQTMNEELLQCCNIRELLQTRVGGANDWPVRV